MVTKQIAKKTNKRWCEREMKKEETNYTETMLERKAERRKVLRTEGGTVGRLFGRKHTHTRKERRGGFRKHKRARRGGDRVSIGSGEI